MTPRELAGEATNRARRRITEALSRASDNPESTYVSDAELRRVLGGNSIADLAAKIRANSDRSLLPGFSDLDSTVAAVRRHFPASIEQSQLDAEAILDHRINVFGRIFDLGQKIDWHRDPQSDVRWPLSHYTQVPLVIQPGADVRVVWELNRLHD